MKLKFKIFVSPQMQNRIQGVTKRGFETPNENLPKREIIQNSGDVSQPILPINKWRKPQRQNKLVTILQPSLGFIVIDLRTI